jgi:VanZ family protein
MSIKLKRFALYWLPLILYCLFIYIQSDHPTPEQIPIFPYADKVLHVTAYGILGILFYRAYQTTRLKGNIKMLMILSVVSASLYGISDEIHQSFVPSREAEVADVIADMIGAFSGVCLYQLLIVSRIEKPLVR